MLPIGMQSTVTKIMVLIIECVKLTRSFRRGNFKEAHKEDVLV